jgi:signal transduction histidine kinase
MDGFETASLIRSREKTRETPIIFLTANYTSDSQMFKGYAVGAVDYILKPAVPEVLRSKVNAFVELYVKRQALKEEARALREARDSLEERVRERTAELADANKALAVLLEREKVARGAAESISRLKDDFLATLSHELRTPMNAILGWAHMLESGTMTQDKVARAASVIKSNSKAQVHLIEELLDVSRMIGGRIALTRETVDVRSIVDAVLESARPDAESKGLRLQSVLDAVPPVHADKGRVRQIVWNIISNAVKFTPQGGEIHVHLCEADGHVSIAIRDTGVGIDPAFLPRVFERFTQADSSSTRAHGGLGLGMAIVHHLIDLHGGSVHAESPGPNLGATFTVRLPVHATAGDTSPVVIEGTVEDTPIDQLPSLDGVSVIVVDDEPHAREVIATILSARGARVRAAGSAREALEAIAADVPDVIVSDIGMPGEDGYSLMRAIRSLDADRGGQVPAIAVTAYASARDSLAALAAGFHRHLPKPVDPAELVSAVGEALMQPAHHQK